MPIFWKAVLYLEKCGLKVVSCTADGASPNRKCFRMHKALECKAVYRAKNIHAKENDFDGSKLSSHKTIRTRIKFLCISTKIFHNTF